jgi:hypothetical protein
MGMAGTWNWEGSMTSGVKYGFRPLKAVGMDMLTLLKSRKYEAGWSHADPPSLSVMPPVT